MPNPPVNADAATRRRAAFEFPAARIDHGAAIVA